MHRKKPDRFETDIDNCSMLTDKWGLIVTSEDAAKLLRRQFAALRRLVKQKREERIARTKFQMSRRKDGAPARAYSLACDNILYAMGCWLKGKP